MANFISRLFLKPDKHEQAVKVLEKALRRIEPFFLDITGNTITAYPQNGATYLKQGYQGNSIIYSIISKIASKTSEVPGVLYKVKNGQKLQRYQAISKAYSPDALTQLLKLRSESLDEVNEADKFYQLINQPNPSQTEAAFRRSVITFKLIYGGSPVYANMGESKKEVLSTYSYPTPNVRLQADKSLMNFEKAWLQFGGLEVPMAREQVYYIRYLNPDMDVTGKHLYGQSPMMAGLKNLSASNEAVDAMAFLFKTKGANGLFVPKTSDEANAISARPGGTDDARNSLDSLIANRTGSATARPYINMVLDYLSFGMDADELRLIESDESLTMGLARLYDFPLPLLSLKSSTDNNYESAIKYLVSNTCYQHLIDIRDMYNQWLLPLAGATGYFWDFDITAMPEMQKDIKAMAEWLSKTEAVTLNEVRDALKYDRLKLPYMDEPLVSQSRKPISMIDIEQQNIDPSIL